jgi:hypothetical protein
VTEREWLDSYDPELLYAEVRDLLTPEQLRDYACRCCRRIWDRLLDDRSRTAVEVAERFVASTATVDELIVAHENARKAYLERSKTGSDHAAAAACYCATPEPLMLPATANRVLAVVKSKDLERAAQASLLRSIAGNPFRRPQ